MFGKMLNRFYYGKSGQGDYTKEDLPETRWQLFWEMLRVRFSALIRLNLIYAVAWLPAIIVIGRALMLGYSGLSSMGQLQSQLELGEIAADVAAQNAAQLESALRSILMQTFLLLIPAIAITGPATAGVAYVTRNWARDEHAFVWSDFIDALKENWKPALLTSFITSLLPMVMYVCATVYGEMARDNSLFMIPQVLSLMLGAAWLMSLMYMYPQMVTYRLSYHDLVKNSLLMTLGRLPMTAGLKLLSLLPAAICAAVCLLTSYAIYGLLIYGIYYILIGFALSRFVGASYSNAVFDRYININIEGAQVGRGLYRETDEAEEDESAEA